MKISERIEQFRQNLGLSQEELAHRAGMAHSTLSRIVTGKTYPRLETLARLAQVFSVPVWELVAGVDDMANESIPARPDPGPHRSRRKRKRAKGVKRKS